MKSKIRHIFETGFFHIFSSNIIRNIFSFISGVILVRIISKSDYGVYSYANNILSYFMLFSGLGIVSAVFQTCCENHNNDEKYLNTFYYGIWWGGIINLIIAILILLSSIIFKSEIEGTEKYLLMISFLPVINISFDFMLIYFRSKLENKIYSYIILLNSCLVFVFSILGAVFFGVKGLIISNYVTPLITLFWATYKWNYAFKLKKVVLDKKSKMDLWKLSFSSLFANAISSAMYLIDLSMIGFFMKDELAIASYKIAAIIPTAMLFIPNSIITYIYPYFARHNNDYFWTTKRTKTLLYLSNPFFGFLTITMSVFAPYIIPLIFGKQYGDSIRCFRILTIAFYFQATYRNIYSNLLVTQRKIKFNIYEGALTALINIIADYFLIRKYQAEGVALATLVVMIFSSILVTGYYFYVINSKRGKENNV